MNLLTNARRIGRYFWHRRRELLTDELWRQTARIAKARFNIFDRVSEKQFQQNLKAIEQRPWNLHIELSNNCNANCIFCAYQYQTRPKKAMSDAVFEKTLNEYCAIGGGNLMLEVVVGDPLVDTQFVDRVRRARARKEIKTIKTITNGIALHKVGIEALVNSGITEIQISTGPWREDLYEQIYRSKAYDIMLRNVYDLLKQNNAAGCPIDITIAFRSNLPMKETLAFDAYQKIKHLPHKVIFNVDYDSWTGEIKQEDLLPGMRMRPQAKLEREPCFWLYDGPIVFVDGKVGLCGCRDYNANSDLIVGDINKQSLLEIWRSDKTHQLRKSFREGNFPKICTTCTTYMNLDHYRSRKGTEWAELVQLRLKNSPAGKFSSTNNSKEAATPIEVS